MVCCNCSWNWRRDPLLARRRVPAFFNGEGGVAITAKEIIALLCDRYEVTILIEELRCGAGYGGVSAMRIDLWALDPTKSKGFTATAFEVKVSRADFMQDKRKPDKQRGARLFSDYLYYVAPEGIIKVEDLPLWAGLIEVVTYPAIGSDPSQVFLRTTREAVRDEKGPPTWGLVVSLLRRSRELRRCDTCRHWSVVLSAIRGEAQGFGKCSEITDPEGEPMKFDHDFYCRFHSEGGG